MKNGIMPSETKITGETITKLPLFSELNVADLKMITAISQVIRFKKSQTIFCEGDFYRGFYILLKGSVKVSKYSSEGKETVIHLIKPLDAFGDLPLFEGGNYPVNAETLNDSVLLFIPKKEFLNLLSKNSSLSLKMLAGFAKRMRFLTKKVEELTTKEITSRLAAFIVEEIKRSGKDKILEPFVKLTVPKKNIASYLGTITETLSRTFKKLQDEKIIRVSGKTIFVTDYEKLKEKCK
jgi:CRP/FNR family transcriptional regulator